MQIHEQEQMKKAMIDAIEYQRVNDKIMSFAQKKQKVSKANKLDTNEDHGIKAVFKGGVQKFKYQEVLEKLRRIEAIEEAKREKELEEKLEREF